MMQTDPNWLVNMLIAILAVITPVLIVVYIIYRVYKRSKPSVAPITTAEIVSKIEVLRGCEMVGGKFEYKVKVLNESESVINNVVVTILAYPEDCMEISGESMKKLSRIEPNGFRSPQFVFVPTSDCVEGQILATVSFIDFQNQSHSIQVKPYVIRSVCDLLRPLDASVEELEVMLSEMSASSEIMQLKWAPSVLFSKAKVLLPAKNFRILQVEDGLSDTEFQGMIRALAQGKYTGNKIAVRLVVSGPTNADEAKVQIECLSDESAMLTTTIHEIAEGMDSRICMNCGQGLEPKIIDALRDKQPVSCPSCRTSLSEEMYGI